MSPVMVLGMILWLDQEKGAGDRFSQPVGGCRGRKPVCPKVFRYGFTGRCAMGPVSVKRYTPPGLPWISAPERESSLWEKKRNVPFIRRIPLNPGFP